MTDRKRRDISTKQEKAIDGARLPHVVSQLIGRWDDFQFLRSFHELNVLSSFATNCWMPAELVSQQAKRLLPARINHLIERCGSCNLPSRLAHIDLRAFIYTLALRSGYSSDKRQILWCLQGEAIGHKTKTLAHRTKAAAVFAYSYYAQWTFDGLASSTLRLLHQVHPYAPILRNIYEEEIQRGRWLSEQLSDELELTKLERFYTALVNGPMMADRIIAASTFSKNTLIAGGFPAEKITVIPYGVDYSHFKPYVEPHKERQAIILFVGSVCTRKGIGYLLEAWNSLKPQSAKLVIIGAIPESEEIKKALQTIDAVILGRVSDAELVNWFQKADIFCLPSIAEGFGLVLLQALACGTPILATDATGAADILKDHPDVGIMVQSRSTDALASALDSALTRIGEWQSRREDCVNAAATYSWDTFREQVKRWYLQSTNSVD